MTPALREALDRLRKGIVTMFGWATAPSLLADLALLTAAVEAVANYGELPKDRDHPFWSTQLPATCSDEETVRFVRDLYTSLPDLAPMGWAEAMRLLAAAADAGARTPAPIPLLRTPEALEQFLTSAAEELARALPDLQTALGKIQHAQTISRELLDSRVDAGARAREALAALAVPCEALLRAEAAGEVAGMRPMLSDEVSKALKAGVILMRAALLAPTEGRRDGK